jgi:anti-anti-sigma factor
VSGEITSAKIDNRYVIKFSGEIRYTDCPALDAFLKKLFVQEDFDDILIDLTDTVSIDSTNLGYLAKITNHMQERFNRKAVIVSTNEDINRTLDSVGFDDVFNIIEQGPECANETQIETSRASELTPAMIREAHQILSDLNEENRQMFKDVLEQFEKEAEEE